MKRIKIDLEDALNTTKKCELSKTREEGLDVDYGVILPQAVADELLKALEESIEYYEGELTKVKVFGKWHQIPRQQVAYGDDGMKYQFSGVTLPAKPWPNILKIVKNIVERQSGYKYNFVLINRYRNGNDYVGPHRDNETELDKNTPIASLSLGQERIFVFKHRDARKTGKDKRNIPLIEMTLGHGSLLLMNPPTNEFWYHSLPVRKRLDGIRINLTFRKINLK